MRIMFEARIPIIGEVILNKYSAELYDRLQKNLRDGGRFLVSDYINGIFAPGEALEIDAGPGYVGLEWLKVTYNTKLICAETDPELIRIARKNTEEYGLLDRVKFFESSIHTIPLYDDALDFVISSSAMHGWSDPVSVFNRIARILKSGGLYCIADLRRDLAEEDFWTIYGNCSPRELRDGFRKSVMASYTPHEVEELLALSDLTGWEVISHPYGLVVVGMHEKEE